MLIKFRRDYTAYNLRLWAFHTSRLKNDVIKFEIKSIVYLRVIQKDYSC